MYGGGLDYELIGSLREEGMCGKNGYGCRLRALALGLRARLATKGWRTCYRNSLSSRLASAGHEDNTSSGAVQSSKRNQRPVWGALTLQSRGHERHESPLEGKL